MITPTQPIMEVTSPVSVNPDQTGLVRFIRSVRNVFFPSWFELNHWKIDSGVRDVSWAIRCDHDTETLAFADLVFANRDAFRAILITACLLSEERNVSKAQLEQRLKTVRHMAAYIRRDRLTHYLDDIIAGLKYGDVGVEHGSSAWLFVSVEWALPVVEEETRERYDALFEDSLLFTEIKRMLDRESAA